jgi:hypothetical protein
MDWCEQQPDSIRKKHLATTYVDGPPAAQTDSELDKENVNPQTPISFHPSGIKMEFKASIAISSSSTPERQKEEERHGETQEEEKKEPQPNPNVASPQFSPIKGRPWRLQ